VKPRKKRADKGIPRHKKTPCDKCNGTGSVTKWTRDRHGRRISYEAQCDKCHGEGEV
jgi:DnaJ-class molecular chaperone